MPVREQSNNRILPANSRAVDVATKAIAEITPVQQQRYMNAFRVQGYGGVLYNHLLQGRKCSCKAGQKALNTRLGLDGKASPGEINKLITGVETFEIAPYNSVSSWNQDDPFAPFETSPAAPVNKYQGVFDVITKDEPTTKGQRPNGHVVDDVEVGDNGRVDPFVDIDAIVGGFDAPNLGYSDVSCAICFGTGFVGGYSPFSAQRQVITVSDVELQGNINLIDKPWSATDSFAFQATLPRNPVSIDVFRVMYKHTPIYAQFKIDGKPIDSYSTLIPLCDGGVHDIEVTLRDGAPWTHMEMQFNLTTESAYFEFPRLTKGNDTSLLEQLEPFQIILSPNIPSVRSMDVIVESTFGKVLVIQNSNWWNTRNRDVMGWECMVRVIQPQELYRILPHRGRIPTKNQTTELVRDNVTGPRRT